MCCDKSDLQEEIDEHHYVTILKALYSGRYSFQDKFGDSVSKFQNLPRIIARTRVSRHEH